MGIGDVVESVVENRTKGPINSAQGTSEPVPLLVAEVGRVDI